MIFVNQLILGQEYFPTNSGVKTEEDTYKAITNVTIHSNSNQITESNSILIHKGKIIQIGKNIPIPKNARIYNMESLHIYPSFIELHTDFGIKKPKRIQSSGRSAEYSPKRKGYYWNDHILSDYNSIKDYNYNKDMAAKMRKIGFGVVNSHRKNGIHRGTSVLIALNDFANDGERILSDNKAEHFSFSKSVTSSQSYPGSIMGSMALIRQLYHDANWYKQGENINKDISIESILDNIKLPKIFDAGDKLNVLRAGKISSEMGLNFIIKGSGNEYQNIDEIKALGNELIIPLNFPDPYDVSDPLLTKKIELSQMLYWNQAPSNPSLLEKSKIIFALTASDLKNQDNFLKNLRKAVKYGLSEKTALEALTIIPAKILKMENKIGVLKKGAYANFIVTSGSIFDDKTKIFENWVNGHAHVISDRKKIDIDGKYQISIGVENYDLEIKNSTSSIQVNVKLDSIKLNSKANYRDGWLHMTLFDKSQKNFARLSSKIDSEKFILSSGVDFDGENFDSVLKPVKSDSKENEKKNKVKKENIREVLKLRYPNNAYGFEKIPKPENVLYKNVTLWTNEKEGIIENTDLLVKNGKINLIGKDLNIENVKIIDGTGKHLTSGIIDEHSHIAASSINEGGQNSSAEVTIEDVIDPDDINIYRNLSGGVTTIQILHGSANPIGGRSAIIKLKWGSSIEEMLYPNSKPFIKFALGENVKQSNWGSFSRFPQTRMGVEQLYIDYFQRAREYGQRWTNYNNLDRKTKSRTPKPRYDIEMEILWEILQGKRYISCHSYVQSEINMLMKVAEKFDFRIRTFTHILEGYKVADKMKIHGVGGSTFSDWWAYKFEVNDAIPYNGAIMHNAGVTVAYNSDSAEMSRRLNQEAAKAIKYGGVSEEEAWKFVTLNPAKLLGIDDKVGSIKVGKIADLVLWSGHPMSIYSQVEKTMIEGAFYYEADLLPAKIKQIEDERKKLILQMLNEKNMGSNTTNFKQRRKTEFHCETIDY
ncbi:MAG: amidohydrolase [Flavobacteriaceae bacterium]|nr:amidohydrolase [Flavobacteriaceae bacterium]